MHSDHAANESRTLRERLASADDALDVLDAGGDPACSAALVCKTIQVATYPTSPAGAYACNPCDINGTESEGSAAAYVPRTGTVLFVWNAGTAVIPQGTTILAHACGGRFVTRYDG